MLPRMFVSSLKVRIDVFLPLGVAGGNLHLLLPRVPVASSVHILIENLSSVQSIFCRRKFISLFGPNWKAKGPTGYF